MRQQARKIFITSRICFLAVSFFGLFPRLAISEAACPHKIGAILPLTGDLASMGRAAREGATLGSPSPNERIRFEDDQFDPKRTISAFQKFKQQTDTKLLICFASGPCNAIAPLAEKEHLPLIAIASDETLTKDRRWVFRLEISPKSEAQKLLKFIKEKGYSRIGALVAEQAGIQSGYGFLKNSNEYSHREVVSISVAPDTSDLRTQVSTIAILKPDAVFIGLLSGYAGHFSRLLAQQDYRGPLLGMNFIEGPESIEAARGTLDGIVYTNSSEPSSEFVSRFKDRWKLEPGFGAAHGYDAVKLLEEACNDNFGLENIRNYVSTIREYKGALGTYNATGTNEFSIPVVLKTLKDGKFIELQDGA